MLKGGTKRNGAERLARIGRAYHAWRVIAFVAHGILGSTYRCQCICGTLADIKIGALQSGITKHCGCGGRALKENEMIASEAPTWTRFDNIFSCGNGTPKKISITVEAEWADEEERELFLVKMGEALNAASLLMRTV